MEQWTSGETNADRIVKVKNTYSGLECQEDSGQEEDEAFQADGAVLEDKVCDAHHPDQMKEVKAVDVGLSEDQAGDKNIHGGFLLVVENNNIKNS